MLPWSLLLLIAVACGRGEGRASGELTVAAASSLREVLLAEAGSFEAANPGVSLVFSFDASSALARQIQAGAEYDVFLSADLGTLERVSERWAQGAAELLLRGEIVLARGGSGAMLASLDELVRLPGKIAIAGAAVPAGIYARALLAAHDLEEELSPRFVLASNVRAALALVESGSAEWAFVYRTDLWATDRSRLEAAWSEGSPSVAWYGVTLSTGEGAARFLKGLGEEGFLSRAEALGFLGPEVQ